MNNAGTFDKLIPLLTESVFIVIAEMPGHGFSSHLPAGISYHYMDFVACIRRVIKYLGWKKYWYLGHSMGATLGYMYSSIFSDEIEKFVSIDNLMPITDQIEECRTKYCDGINAFLALDKMQKEELANPKGFTFEEIQQRLIKYMELSNHSITKEAAKFLSIRGSKRINEYEWCYSRDQRLMASTHRFTLPDYLQLTTSYPKTLIILAKECYNSFRSKNVVDQITQHYSKICKTLRIVTLDGNHFLHLNNPQQTANEINMFFNQK